MQQLNKCDSLDEQGRYREAIICYIDEYQPSSASLQLKDPIFKSSKSNEQIQVRRMAVPNWKAVAVPLVIGGAIVLGVYVLCKS